MRLYNEDFGGSVLCGYGIEKSMALAAVTQKRSIPSIIHTIDAFGPLQSCEALKVSYSGINHVKHMR